MQSTSLPAATVGEKMRWLIMQEVGCVACRQLVPGKATPGEVHHLLDGGRRISHRDTVILCPWHHRGVPESHSEYFTRISKGPSLAKEPAGFHEQFGSDEDLLEFQNELIRGYADQMGSGVE